MLRISTHSRSLLSSMASSPPRWWLQTLVRRFSSATAVLRLNPPLRHVSRFPHGSRNMASDSGVKGEELAKQDRRRPISSANNPIQTTKDIMISMDKRFPVIRGIGREENGAAIEEFIARYSNVHPDNIDEDVRMTTMDVTDGKQDPMGAVKEVADGEDARDQRDSEVSGDSADEEFIDCHEHYPCDGSIHWIPLRRSSHRDGSIYRGIFGSGWKNDYRIAERNENGGSTGGGKRPDGGSLGGGKRPDGGSVGGGSGHGGATASFHIAGRGPKGCLGRRPFFYPIGAGLRDLLCDNMPSSGFTRVCFKPINTCHYNPLCSSHISTTQVPPKVDYRPLKLTMCIPPSSPIPKRSVPSTFLGSLMRRKFELVREPFSPIPNRSITPLSPSLQNQNLQDTVSIRRSTFSRILKQQYISRILKLVR